MCMCRIVSKLKLVIRENPARRVFPDHLITLLTYFAYWLLRSVFPPLSASNWDCADRFWGIWSRPDSPTSSAAMLRRLLALLVATQSVNGLVLTPLSARTTPIEPPLVKMHGGRQLITGALTGMALVAALQGPLPAQALDTTQPSMVAAQPSVLLADANDFQAKEAAKQAKARAAIEALRIKQAGQDEIAAQKVAAREAEKAERMIANRAPLAGNTIAQAKIAKAKSDALAKAAAEEQEAAAAKAAAAENAVAQAAAQAEAAEAEAKAAAAAKAEQAKAAAEAAKQAKADKIAAYEAKAKAEQQAFEEGKAARAAADKAFLEKQRVAK